MESSSGNFYQGQLVPQLTSWGIYSYHPKIYFVFPKAAFTLYRITFDPIQKCSFSLAFTLYQYSFRAVQVQNCSSLAAFTLYRITFDPIQKCSFSLAFTLYQYSFRAVQVQNCSSLAAFTLYRITFDPIQKYSFSLAFTLYQITLLIRYKSIPFPSRLHCTGTFSE